MNILQNTNKSVVKKGKECGPVTTLPTGVRPAKISDWVKRGLVRKATTRSRVTLNMILPSPGFTMGMLLSRW